MFLYYSRTRAGARQSAELSRYMTKHGMPYWPIEWGGSIAPPSVGFDIKITFHIPTDEILKKVMIRLLERGVNELSFSDQRVAMIQVVHFDGLFFALLDTIRCHRGDDRGIYRGILAPVIQIRFRRTGFLRSTPRRRACGRSPEFQSGGGHFIHLAHHDVKIVCSLQAPLGTTRCR